jgi:ribonuclease D
MTLPELVSSQAVLNAHCLRWREAGVFAFDTEFIRDDTYEARLCLVQAIGGNDREVVLIDPMTPELDLAPFWELVTDPDVVTIVHAGKEDFEVCLRATGQAPRNVFDVQIGCGLVGYGYPLNLARIVELVRRRKLRKGQTLTDWAIRPLTEDQLRYAVEDVIHLPAIYRKLQDKLATLNRLQWAAEEFARFESPQHYQAPIQDRVQRLKGSRSLDGLGLLVLERLVAWRDQWAQEKNRPVRALIRDDVLVDIARRRPKSASELAVMRGFPQSRNARVVQHVLSLLEEAAAVPKSQWPVPTEIREETPMMKATIDLLSAVTRAVCFENSVSHELVCTTQRLRELIDYDLGRESEPPVLLRGWRKDFLGQGLLNLLRGRSEVHFSGWPQTPRIDVVKREKSPGKAPAAETGEQKPRARAKRPEPVDSEAEGAA